MIEFLLERHLDEKVRFITAWDTELEGEVTVLSDGKVGIVTHREVYEARHIKHVRRSF